MDSQFIILVNEFKKAINNLDLEKLLKLFDILQNRISSDKSLLDIIDQKYILNSKLNRNIIDELRQIRNIKDSMLLDPINIEYLDKLSKIYIQLNRFDLVERLFIIAYRNYDNIGLKKIDIKSLEIKQGDFLDLDQREIELPNNLQFIPSRIIKEDFKGFHLMHIHPGRTGGHRFSKPLLNLIEQYYNNQNNSLSKYHKLSQKKEINFLSKDSIFSYELKGLSSYLKQLTNTNIDFSYLSFRSIPHRYIYDLFAEKFAVKPFRMGIYRDPIQRLQSVINVEYSKTKSLELILDMINTRHKRLDNMMFRGYYDFFDKEITSDLNLNIEVDALIEIDNNQLFYELNSFVLSRCRLPNLITEKKTNTLPKSSKLSDHQMNFLIEKCSEKGLLNYDSNQFLKRKIIKQLPFDIRKYSQGELHPLTAIARSRSAPFFSVDIHFIETAYLLSQKGQEYIKNIFSRKS